MTCDLVFSHLCHKKASRSLRLCLLMYTDHLLVRAVIAKFTVCSSVQALRVLWSRLMALMVELSMCAIGGWMCCYQRHLTYARISVVEDGERSIFVEGHRPMLVLSSLYVSAESKVSGVTCSRLLALATDGRDPLDLSVRRCWHTLKVCLYACGRGNMILRELIQARVSGESQRR